MALLAAAKPTQRRAPAPRPPIPDVEQAQAPLKPVALARGVVAGEALPIDWTPARGPRHPCPSPRRPSWPSERPTPCHWSERVLPCRVRVAWLHNKQLHAQFPAGGSNVPSARGQSPPKTLAPLAAAQQLGMLVGANSPSLVAGEQVPEIGGSSYGKLASCTTCVARCSRCHCVVMAVATMARTVA